jgi:RHS repeat-associated protein
VRVFTYDGLGRTVQELQYTVGVTWTMDYTYDAAGNLTSFTDSKFSPGAATTYVYDDANQLIQTIEPGGSCTSGTTAPAANSGCIKFEYDVNGAETKRTFPGGAAVTTAVDASGRPTRITAADSSAAAKADVGYSYTAAGGTGPSADRTSIQTRTAHQEQGITPGAITTYTYDSLKRLTAATETVGATTSSSWAYAYDSAGNRTAQTRAGATGATAGAISYTYDAANRLTAATGDTTAWTYDGAGNQTTNGITGAASTYNVRGGAVSNGTASYATHAGGNTDTRSRLVGSTTTRYLTSSLGLSGEEVGSALRAFTRTPDGEALANRLGGGSRYYYATDHQGSVIGMFSTTGGWLGGYSYSPYGEARSTATGTAPATNSLRYISGYYDTSAGLYKLGARYYDEGLGRFTQFDPSGQEANPFSYAACNPAGASDPSGLSAVSTIVGVVSSVVAGNSLGQAIGGVTRPQAMGIAWGGVAAGGCILGAAALGVATGGIGAVSALACIAIPQTVSIAAERFYTV